MSRPLDPKGLLRALEESRAMLKGHFRLSSGLHSDAYFQCALLLTDPDRAEAVGRTIAAKLPPAWNPVETVVSPALGGLIVGHETARALDARHIFTERKEGRMELRRGFSVREGERVLVVEDVVTTGKSSAETVAVLRALGAEVIGAACIVRRGKDLQLDVPVHSLLELEAVSFPESECPQCAAGVPVEKPGSRPG